MLTTPRFCFFFRQDALLTQFELTVAALVPLTPTRTEADLRVNFVDGIIMQALSARLDAMQQVRVCVRERERKRVDGIIMQALSARLDALQQVRVCV
jgi:chorismate mutase